MIQKTNYTTKARVPSATTAEKAKVRRNTSRLYTSTVEYTMIAPETGEMIEGAFKTSKSTYRITLAR